MKEERVGWIVCVRACELRVYEIYKEKEKKEVHDRSRCSISLSRSHMMHPFLIFLFPYFPYIYFHFGILNRPGLSGPCQLCPVGTTDHDLNPATACTDCGPGYDLSRGGLSGACSAFRCARGTTDDDYNSSTACVTCAAGTFLAIPGLAGPCSTFQCEKGSTDHDRNTSTPCLACPAGTSVTTAGATGTCPPCAAGTIDDDEEASTPCVACTDAGLYVPVRQAGSCASFACPAGTVDDDRSSATACVACPPGSREVNGECVTTPAMLTTTATTTISTGGPPTTSNPVTTQSVAGSRPASKTIPMVVATAAGCAILVGAVVCIVCWLRRRRRNAAKTKLATPSTPAFLTNNPASFHIDVIYEEPDVLHHDYDLPNPNLFEMISVSSDTGSALSSTATSIHDPAVDTADKLAPSADSYSGLASSHKTYTQTSQMALMADQEAADSTVAAAYEEPVPAMRARQRLSSNESFSQGPQLQSHIYHLAGDSGQYVDMYSSSCSDA
jgi:hypothetical protein